MSLSTPLKDDATLVKEFEKKWESPLSISGPPNDCVELTIYDNDGPEGFYQRLRFLYSHQAVKFLFDNFDEEELLGYNFKIENHWGK